MCCRTFTNAGQRLHWLRHRAHMAAMSCRIPPANSITMRTRLSVRRTARPGAAAAAASSHGAPARLAACMVRTLVHVHRLPASPMRLRTWALQPHSWIGCAPRASCVKHVADCAAIAGRAASVCHAKGACVAQGILRTLRLNALSAITLLQVFRLG